MSRYMTVADVNREYDMPAVTQKVWRMSGKFKKGRDFVKIGPTVAYKPKALEKNEWLKAYTARKLSTT